MNITYSPWGTPQHQTEIAPGIIAVSTASHGGIYLEEGRALALQSAMPEFKPWAGWPWLEEDCDAAVAAVFWPEFFEPYAVRCAVISVKCGSSAAPKQWLASEYGMRARQVAKQWEAQHYGEWEACGGCSHKDGWISWMQQVGTDKHCERFFADYPRKHVFTQAEIDAQTKPATRPEPRRLAVTFQPEDCGGVFDGNMVTSDADPGL